jgi:hypothetical protein
MDLKKPSRTTRQLGNTSRTSCINNSAPTLTTSSTVRFSDSAVDEYEEEMKRLSEASSRASSSTSDLVAAGLKNTWAKCKQGLNKVGGAFSKLYRTVTHKTKDSDGSISK